MKSLELSGLLATPTAPTVREALRHMPPHALDELIIEALAAAEKAWQRVVVDRVAAFLAGQSVDGPRIVAAYFTPTERTTQAGTHPGWSPFVAALASTEDIPDLTHARTTAVAVPMREAALSEEIFADPHLRNALNRLAALDPPSHTDVLRVHLPTRQVTRLTP
ncbi:hypothetical protein ABZV34_27075 [Streptomyces sp. NPDC005195]|uniref:hypothetical protein n=1 Tax=Streptomyces sp. NPDC005195 TaxID=3154561 RepID=UPI0033B5946B